jgi:hypothetical protein
MMRKRTVFGVVAMAISVMLIAVSAYAVTDTATSNGNTLSVKTPTRGSSIGGPYVTCFGRNQKIGGVTPTRLLVSWVCQKKPNSGGTWIDATPAKSFSCLSGCRDTTWKQGNFYYCTDSNYRLSNGSWRIRSQADGYWVDADGHPHEYSGALGGSNYIVVQVPGDC